MAKIDQVHLLPVLAHELVIPRAVAREIERSHSGDPAREWLLREGVQWVQPVRARAARLMPWRLDAGERAALSWALQHPGFELVADDRAARRCAESLGVPV